MTKDDVYILIARVYHYTFEQIANMTPAVHAKLLGIKTSPTVTFATHDDYLKWKHEQFG